MTTTIYVTSTQNFSGKSALCVGLLRRFHADGFVIGYMKPVSASARIVGTEVVDEDVFCTVCVTGHEVRALFRSGEKGTDRRRKEVEGELKKLRSEVLELQKPAKPFKAHSKV